MEIKSTTGFEAWIKALDFILNQGRDFIDDDKRVCREVRNVLIIIEKPYVTPTRCIDTLRSFQKWYYPSHEEIVKVVFERKTLPGYTYNYGPRLFSFAGRVNQIDDYVIKLLSKKRSSRRAVAVTWNPEEDANIYSKEVPSTIILSFMIRGENLYTTAFVRSNDILFGYPVDLYQVFSLQDYVARKLNRKVGNLAFFSFSAHIFKDQFDDINRIINHQKI